MRHFLLTVITLTLFGNVSGQKIEFSASLNSGLFSFIGGYAVKTTFLQTGSNSIGPAIIGNSLGAKGGLCHGGSVNFKRIIQKKYFFGVDLGYEVLRSRAEITQVYEHTPNPSGSGFTSVVLNITGNAFTNNSFINTNPFVGYRCKYKQTNFDLIAGMDIGYYLKVSERGNAKKTDGTNYEIDYSNVYKNINFDFRPRFQVSSNYKKLGVYFGYAYGVSSYDPMNLHIRTSRLIRFGLSYQLLTTNKNVK